MPADVQAIINFARMGGIAIGEFEAKSFLLAKRILQRDPRDEIAQAVVASFGRSFAAFMLTSEDGVDQ